ncbi:c-type cytochrome [Variovorax sp. GT1P44]|uniref:c-type cytochrome n=1 Tax=Variovorax sp. GT1P44 TaxID=3443742 RepID=UPI003F47F1A8
MTPTPVACSLRVAASPLEGATTAARRSRFRVVSRTRLAALVAAGAALVCCGGVGAQQAPAQPAAVPAKAAACAACHGADGQPIQAVYPIIAGQTSRYLYLQLRDFQEGRRANELMTPMVAGMTREEMRELADYFAAQKPPRQRFAANADKAKLGKLKSEETLCTMCHLGGFAGQNEVPRVSGQNYDYIVKQLSDFKAHKRTNDAGTMTSVANTLSAQDIENVAHFLTGL